MCNVRHGAECHDCGALTPSELADTDGRCPSCAARNAARRAGETPPPPDPYRKLALHMLATLALTLVLGVLAVFGARLVFSENPAARTVACAGLGFATGALFFAPILRRGRRHGQ